MATTKRQQPEHHQLRHMKDYDFQCDDLSVLVNVSDFKRRCREIHDDVLGDHESDHVSYPATVMDNCSTDSLMPAEGLEQYTRGPKKAELKKTKLQCFNQPDAMKAHFDSKGLMYHGIGEITNSYAQSFLSGPSVNRVDGDQSVEMTTGSSVTSDTSATCQLPMAESGEIILSAYVYHPIKRRREMKLHLLGCQRLTEVRDHISCFRDFIVDRDYSENPDLFNHSALVAGVPTNQSPSAFFFINNTFYNDSRYPNCVNLSQPIIEWSQQCDIERSPRLDHYQMADMASTRIDQLSLRLGYPYLYCHHDNCQHLIVFCDLRLLHPTETHVLTDYPRIFVIHSTKRKLCMACGVFSPRWITLDDELAPETPCVFCSSCFKKLHYTADGKKICNFKAYPYNPNQLLLKI